MKFSIGERLENAFIIGCPAVFLEHLCGEGLAVIVAEGYPLFFA